ncbi:MAG: hypothetical protein WCO56_10940 [Verrucomicrobiota bacterium]
MTDHGMVIPQVPFAAWQTLHDAAARFMALKPWTDMYDTDYLGITDPQTGQLHVGMVMGNLGQFHAFAMYREREGIEFCRTVQNLDDEWAARPDNALRQNVIMGEFTTKKELDETDLAVLAGIVWKGPKRGAQSHVRCRNSRPNLFPWYLDAEEVRILTLGFDLMTDYCEYRRGGNLVLEADEKHLPSVRMDGSAPKYYLREWPVQAPLPDEPDGSAAFMERATRLKKQISKSHGSWELGNWPICMPTHSATRPYFPEMVLAADEVSHCILATKLANPFSDQPGNVLATVLLDGIEKSGCKPEEVQVFPSRHNATLKSLCALLGFPLVERDELPTFEEAYRDFDEHIQHVKPC